MSRGKRVCLEAGCPRLTDSTRCPEHEREHDRARGTRQQRGYDAQHDALRARWAPHVEAGLVDCWRCLEPIPPGSSWHLGHDDHDRSRHHGPEHATCNLRAAGHRPGG